MCGERLSHIWKCEFVRLYIEICCGCHDFLGLEILA